MTVTQEQIDIAKAAQERALVHIAAKSRRKQQVREQTMHALMVIEHEAALLQRQLA